MRAHLSEVLDGDLRGAYGAYVRFHSTICPPCRRVRASLVRTTTLLHKLRDEPPPAEPERDRSARER